MHIQASLVATLLFIHYSSSPQGRNKVAKALRAAVMLERRDICSDSVVGTGPSPEEGDQIVVDYTGVRTNNMTRLAHLSGD